MKVVGVDGGTFLLHFVVNAQENKKNTILSYKRESGKYLKNKKNRGKVVCVRVFGWVKLNIGPLSTIYHYLMIIQIRSI
jgi:hypothetical protein